jgi:formylglycine-generating enzyme required for sulfatase activity
MGCSPGDYECGADEKPLHRVTINRGFWIGQTEVTVGAYKKFAGSSGRQMPGTAAFNKAWTNDNMPMVNVAWDDAQAYCAWTGGALPTEAEWEYAARGGSTEARYGNLDDIAWYDQDSGGQAHDVAQKRVNGFGLYDMLGNVWEWANDFYDPSYYQSSPAQDPPGPPNGEHRALLGGSWNSYGGSVRVSVRGGVDPTNFGFDTGFRCVGEVANPWYFSLVPLMPSIILHRLKEIPQS